MNNKLIMGLMGVVVSVVLVASILVPVISSATETHTTFENQGYFYMDDSKTHTLSYSQADNFRMVVDGVEIPPTTDVTLVATNNSILRYNPGDHTLQYKGNNSYSVGISYADLTIGDGKIVGTWIALGVTQSINLSYTEVYVISGCYEPNLMCKYNTPVKVNEDSEIHAFGQTVLTIGSAQATALMRIEGTINDLSVEILNPSGSEVLDFEVSNLKANYVEDSKYIDLYTLSSITFDVADDSGSIVPVTYSAYIVPSKVTAELTNHLSAGQIAIMSAIVVMVLVAILMIVVPRRD